MKKETKILISLISFLLLAIILISLSNSIQAADTQPQYPFGINPEQIQNLPQTPEEISNTTASYLKKEIGLMLAKIPGLVRINEFLKAHPMVFTILFNEPYNISWNFLCIILLWLYLMAIIADIVKASPFVGGRGSLHTLFSLVIGIAMSIIFSQLGIIKSIVVFSLSLLFAQSLWWVRLILGVLIILIFFVIYYGKAIAVTKMNQQYKINKEEALEEEAKRSRALRKGMEEKEKITENFK